MPPKLWHGFSRKLKSMRGRSVPPKLGHDVTKQKLPFIFPWHKNSWIYPSCKSERLYYNLRKIIFSLSSYIKGKSMPPKLWHDVTEQKIQFKSNISRLTIQSLTKQFEFLPRVNPFHQNWNMDLHGNWNQCG